MDNETFIKKAKEVHGEKYDYSLSQYHHDRSIRTTIICQEHGPFEQRPKNHLAGRGCNQCSVDAKASAKKAKSGLEILERFRLVHGDRYDYTKFTYLGMNSKTTVTCKSHGDFEITPANHLWDKGCRDCYLQSKLLTKHEFLERAAKTHGDKYDYTHVEIVASGAKVKIKCPIHGYFNQSYSSHISGNGCPSCSVTGYKASKPGKLYILELGIITKIGITNRNLEERVSQIRKNSGKNFIPVSLFDFEDGSVPLRLETMLLRELKSKYSQPLEVYDGSTESFINVDVPSLLERIKNMATELTT